MRGSTNNPPPTVRSVLAGKVRLIPTSTLKGLKIILVSPPPCPTAENAPIVMDNNMPHRSIFLIDVLLLPCNIEAFFINPNFLYRKLATTHNGKHTYPTPNS